MRPGLRPVSLQRSDQFLAASPPAPEHLVRGLP